MWEDLWKGMGAGLAAALVAVITVFSDRIVGRIRLAMNRADLRAKQYEEMALDLSDFVFHAELQYEFHEAGWNANAITKDYNKSITTLRGKEFVYRSWVRRFWTKEDVSEFEKLFQVIREVDRAVHAFNNAADIKTKTDALGGMLTPLREQVESWLSKAVA
jgi:hypothetical protein